MSESSSSSAYPLTNIIIGTHNTKHSSFILKKVLKLITKILDLMNDKKGLRDYPREVLGCKSWVERTSVATCHLHSIIFDE